MKQDLESCEDCGCVCDIEKLKAIEERKSNEQREKEDYNSSYHYRDYYDFIKWKCPACKILNQR